MVETTLDLLNALDEDIPISQRSLAMRLGVALGLTNTLLKRCVKKGILKVSQAPARRFIYYLTPKGFNEKSRLTAEYLTNSLNFFRRARLQYQEAMEYCVARDWTRVALYGTSELAEIATLASNGLNIDLISIIDNETNASHFHNTPVIRSTANLENIDVIIITNTKDPQDCFLQLLNDFPEERIITPDLLHVTRNIANYSFSKKELKR